MNAKTYASTNRPTCWSEIDFAVAEKSVKKLQRRIYVAYVQGNTRKWKTLTEFMFHSFYARACAVKHVCSRKGKKTAGVDNVLWLTDTDKFNAIFSLRLRGYKPRPLKRVYIKKPMLNYKVVEPPANASHLILSGELNQILKELIEDRFGGLFVVSGENSGVQVSQWEVNRYVTLLDAIMSLLSAYKSRLQIRYIEPENLDYGYILTKAVPITDYSDEEEYSKEGNARVTVRDRRSGINHLVCAGEGQNEERAVIHLYVQKDGSIGQVQYYKELEERAAVYNFSSADEERLIEDGTKRLQELQNQKSCEIEIEDNLELELGDIISGYDPVTDTQVKRPIIRKILKKQNEKVTIEYKIEGDD